MFWLGNKKNNFSLLACGITSVFVKYEIRNLDTSYMTGLFDVPSRMTVKFSK